MKNKLTETITLGDPNIEHMPFKRVESEVMAKLGHLIRKKVPVTNAKLLELDEILCNILNSKDIPWNADCFQRRMKLCNGSYIAGETEREYEKLTADWI